MIRVLAARKTIQKLSTQTPALYTQALPRVSSEIFTPTTPVASVSKVSVKTKFPVTPKIDLAPKFSSTPKVDAAPKVSSTSLSFFTQLKKEERRLSRKRTRFEYEDNFTSALASPYSTTELSEKHSDTSSLLSMSEKYISEHASRRVDLFFYTLIAYYRTNVKPIEGHTVLEHGKGRTLSDETNLTQACHSSFTPSLLDQTIYKKRGKRSLLSGTHLLESLNSTVELPPFVNAFDNLLESICRPRCVEILQKVAVGELNPVQGLNQFLIMMDTLLQDFERQASAKTYSGLSHPIFSGQSAYINPKLIEVVSNGTLGSTFLEDAGTANEEYVQLLLRMNKDEKAACQGGAKKREKIYSKKFTELQEEILQSESLDHSFSM